MKSELYFYDPVVLEAAEAIERDPGAVRKAGFPSRPEFDEALQQLADEMRLSGEPIYKAYGRALESRKGQLLYQAREWAPVPMDVIRKQNPPGDLSAAEKAIAEAVTDYMEMHPGCLYEKAFVKVLETDPRLYTAYEREHNR